MIGFDFTFRPFRILYICILTFLVYWITNSYWGAGITALGIFDVDISELKNYIRERFGG